MLDSQRLLLNIKLVHQHIIDVGKMDLDPNEKAAILYNLDREKAQYEADLFIAIAREKSEQTINR